MKDEEFVKLRFWLDGELTLIRVMLALVIGLLIQNTFVWWGVGLYTLYSLAYAAVRIAFVEKKHMGYMRLPKL